MYFIYSYHRLYEKKIMFLEILDLGTLSKILQPKMWTRALDGIS